MALATVNIDKIIKVTSASSYVYETVLSNSILQLSDHTPSVCLWSVMADRKCTHALWRQREMAKYYNECSEIKVLLNN